MREIKEVKEAGHYAAQMAAGNDLNLLKEAGYPAYLLEDMRYGEYTLRAKKAGRTGNEEFQEYETLQYLNYINDLNLRDERNNIESLCEQLGIEDAINPKLINYKTNDENRFIISWEE